MGKRIIRMATYAAVLLAATGCASIVNDAMQPMKLETQTAAGETITGAECRIQNSGGTISARSGETARVRRSSEDLEISCTHPGNPEAIGRAISRANAWMAGNIIFGGLIGVVLDHGGGEGYTYPSWVQLVFGKTLVFDRRAEKEGFPVVGVEPNSGTDAQTPSAPKSPAAANPSPAPQPAPAAQPVSTTAQPAPKQPAQAAQPVTSGLPMLTRQPLMLNSEPKPAPSAQPQTQTAQPPDVQQRLEKLQSLRNNGLITQEEYQAKKKEILDAF